MKILLCVPSSAEHQILQCYWQEHNDTKIKQDTWHHLDHDIKPIITGVGLMRTSYTTLKALQNNAPIDMALMLGVAGSSSQNDLGSAYAINSEEIIDGVWEEGMLLTDFDLGLEDPGAHPYIQGKLKPELPEAYWKNLPQARSATTSTLMDDVAWCEERLKISQASLETMEGAAFYYVTNRECIPSLQIRGISNHVGVRDKSKWKIEEAMKSAHDLLLQVLQNIAKND